MKKIHILLLLLSLFLFKTVWAQDKCGVNVKYTISGNTISFSKEDSAKDAEWQSNCGSAFKNKSAVTKVNIDDKIIVSNGAELFKDFQYVEEMNLSKFDVSKASSLYRMFYNCSALKKLDLSGWDTSKVTVMTFMFWNCQKLDNLNISGWKTSNVTRMDWMFNDCAALKTLDVSSWDTSKVTDMHYMFNGCKSLTGLDVSKWNTANATDMHSMFSGCESLTTLNVSGWDTSKVKDMNSMFRNCKGLTNLDVQKWNTSAVADMNWLFDGCSSLTSLDLSKWNTGKVTGMNSMFNDCSSLASLDVSGWNTANVTDMASMFTKCSSLKYLDLSSWNTSKVTSMSSVFSDCDNLITLKLGKDSLKKNIFTSLPKYVNKWYYVEQGDEASNPLSLKTVKSDTALFTAYAYDQMAGTWTTKIETVASMKLQNSEKKDVTGQSIIVSDKNYQLKAIAAPVNSLQKFTWKSSDNNIATVDANGKVTFKKDGKVTITATADDGSNKNATVDLTYAPLATAIKIFDADGKDVTEQTVTVKTSDCQLTATYAPAVPNQKFTWTSSDKSIAVVDDNGKVSFKKDGTVTITAKAADGSGKSTWVKLTLAIGTPGSITIKVNNIRGYTNGITVKFEPSENASGYKCAIWDYETDENITSDVTITQETSGEYDVIRFYGSVLENGHPYKMTIQPFNKVGDAVKYGTKKTIYGAPNPRITAITAQPGNKSAIFRVVKHATADGFRYNVYAEGSSSRKAYYDVSLSSGSLVKNATGLTNGKLYYVTAIPYTLIKGNKYWGASMYRIYFVPLSVPSNIKASFSGSKATISMNSDSAATGIKVLYRVPGGSLVDGCEATGSKCSISGLKKDGSYEFYVMKYKTVNGKKHFGPGANYYYKTSANELPVPTKPLIAKRDATKLSFTIEKNSKADGISVLYRENEGTFQLACEAKSFTCMKSDFDWNKDYTFYIMQYKTVNKKKVYSAGITVTNWLTPKSAGLNDEEELTGLVFSDSVIPDDLYEAFEDYYTEEDLMWEEAMLLLGQEDLEAKSTAYDEEFIDFDEELYTDDEQYLAEAEMDQDLEGEEPGDMMPETEELPSDQESESVSDEDLYMYRFDGTDGTQTLPVPSFNNK